MAANSRREERYLKQKRRKRVRIMIATGVVALIAIVLVLVFALGGSDTSKPTAFNGSVVKVTLSEFAIKGNLTVPTGAVRIDATNIGGVVHNIGVRGVKISRDIKPRENFILDVGVLAPGTYELYCDIINPVDKTSHVSHGMVAKLLVTPADASTTTTVATATS